MRLILKALALGGMVLSLLSRLAFSQVYPFRVLTSSDGLPHSFSYCTYQDRWGYIWVGTFGGAARFDGKTFRTFSMESGLPGNNVRGIREDRKGRLWLAVNGGVVRFPRGESGEVLERERRVWTAKDGLPSGYAVGLVEDRSDGMWVLTRDGGACLIPENGTVTRVLRSGQELPKPTLWCGDLDLEGSLWLGTRGAGVVRVTGGTVTTFTEKDGLPDSNIFDVKTSPDGVVHVATSKGVARFDAASSRFSLIDYGAESGTSTSSVAFDSAGTLWVGRYGRGLAKVRRSGTTIFAEEQGLQNGFVTGLFVDREDSIWITTQGAGVIRFSSDRFGCYDRTAGWPGGAVANGFAEDPETRGIWVGSFGKGAVLLSGSTITRVTAKDGLADDLLRSALVTRDGTLWLGGNAGASYRRKGEPRFTAVPTALYVNGFIEDPDGSIWMATGGGLVKRRPNGELQTFRVEDGLLDNELESIAQLPDGRLYLGGSSGISMYDGRTFQHLTPQSSGIPAGRIFNVVCGRDGTYWFGGDGGVSAAKPNADGTFPPATSWARYGIAQGLPAQEVTALVATRDGDIWVGTGRGVARFDGSRFQLRGGKEEMLGSDVLNRAAFVDSQGRIWWGTPSGPVVYMPWNDRPNTTPPSVYLTDVVVGTESKGPVKNLTLPAGTVGLTLHFVGLSYQDPERVTFKMRLTGFDDTWSTPSPLRQTRYTNLPPGRFQFEVMAASNDGVWSRTPATLTIFVPSPWWKRPFTVALLLLLLFGAVYAAYDLRVSSMKSRARELEEIVAERTEELREEARRTRALLDSMSEAVLFLEPSLKVRMMNPAAQRLLDDTNALDTLLRNPELRAALARVVEDGEPCVLRLQVQSKALQLHAAPVVLRPRTTERGIIVVANDITELLELDRMKSEFVATVSHELRTPLTSIRGSIEMVRDGLAGDVSPRALELLKMAHKNSERLGRLINDILDLEKLESEGMDFRMRSLEVTPLLKSATEANTAFAETQGVGLALGETAPSVRVLVDGDRFIQVMTNLISNAVRFSPKGETVLISSQRLPGGGVRVSVEDRGPGIPEEFRARIFQKFAQARQSGVKKRGGTGLGLAISKAFVEKMGGQIGFTTTDGKGSTFYFDLPESSAPLGPPSSGELKSLR